MSESALKASAVEGQTRANTAARVTKRFNKLVIYGLLGVLVIVFLTPFFWLFRSSLMSQAEFNLYPIVVFPKVPKFENYTFAVTYVPFFTFVGRSFFLASAHTILVVISSSLAGFGFARHRAPGRNTLFILVVAMIMVPSFVTIIPQFMLYSKIGLVGTYWPWILWGLAGSPFQIFLFRQFFSAFPKELEEAAELDGCGRFGIFWRIFLPNSSAVIAASVIFAFQWVWGDFFYQSLFLNESKATLAMKIATAYNDPLGYPFYPATMAAVCIYVLPLILVFFFAQRQIIQGVVTTGLK